MEELIIKQRETKESLVNIINNSGLPACMLKPMLKEFYEQLASLEQQQYVQAKNKRNEQENEVKRGV